MRRYGLLIALIAVALMAGCQSQRRFRYTQVAKLRTPERLGVTYDQAFDVATGVLSDQFGAIDKRDRRSGEIHCKPTVYVPSRLGHRSLRSPLSAASARFRRVAGIKIETRDGVVMAGVRVEIQREDTRARRQFASLRDPYDTEMDASVDEGGEGGVENRVWTFIRFDDAAERDALADLVDRLSQLGSADAPAGDGEKAAK